MPFQDIIGHSTQIGWLRNAIQSNHLGHAYLFVGDDAIGKRMTAMQFIQAMNCETYAEASTPEACDQCRTCQQIMAQIHPDLLIIQPEDSQTQRPQIKIERVREIEHHVIYRPLLAERKICVIDNADCLTISAANALLKTLEEPPDHCLFILITSKPLALLPTIKSRCLMVRFSPPSQDQAITYLMQHRGFSRPDARFVSFLTNARLGESLNLDLEVAKAKQQEFFSLLFDSPHRSLTQSFESAEALSKSGSIPEAIWWLWSGLRDLLLVATQSSPKLLVNEECLSRLKEAGQQISPQKILSLLDELHQLEQGHQRNLNMQLRFEQFFIHLREVISST